MPAWHAILGLLEQQPMHGYEIDAHFDAGLRKVCQVNISQIYSYLKSLESRGWIEGETVVQQNYPPKTVYALTESGRRELGRWLRHPVFEKTKMWDEFLLKLFFCYHLMPEKMMGLMEHQLGYYRGRLAGLRAALAEAKAGQERLLLNVACRHAEADVAWLENALVQLGKGEEAHECRVPHLSD